MVISTRINIPSVPFSEKKLNALLLAISLLIIPLLIRGISSEAKSGKSLIELRTYDQIKQMLKLKPMNERANVVRFNETYLKSPSLPSSYDLRTQNVLTPVKDQDGCCGWPPDGLEYLVTNGVVLEQYYPLTWTDKACTVSRPSDYYLSDWKEVDVWERPLCVRLGGEYHASPALEVRFGILYDQNPIPDAPG